MIFVLLPAYNEAQSFPFLIPKIDDCLKTAGYDYRILICDDGSTDNTRKVAEEFAACYPVTLLTHSLNRGLGETCRDLFEKAGELGRPGDCAVRMDCDDTHDPQYIPSMIQKIDQQCDVVIASRFQPGGGQTGIGARRSLISRAANIFAKGFFPIPRVREYSCGYRAYRIDIIHRALALLGNQFIELKGLGFTCTLEKLVKLKLIGARFGEVPFVHRYDRKRSASKMESGKTLLGYLVLTFLYYWPGRGGWRRKYGRLTATSRHAG